MRAVGAVTSLVVVLTGCAASAGPGGGAGVESDLSVGGRAEHGPMPPPRDEVERTDMTLERLGDWSSHRAVPPRGLRFVVPTGNPECEGLRTVVEESADTVAVAVVRGALPEAPDVCAAVGVLARVLVTLDAPLGEREVVPLDADRVDLAD